MVEKEVSIKDVRTLGEGGVSNNAEKSGQGEAGGIAVSGHLFSPVSLREESMMFWERGGGERKHEMCSSMLILLP